MQVILLVLGVLCIVAGLVPAVWGLDYPFDERNALILRGTVAIIGGLVLIALGSVISQLRLIREALETLKFAPAPSAMPAPAAPDLAQAMVAEPLRKPAAETSAHAETVDMARDSKLSMPSGEEAFKTGARESPVTEWPRVEAADRFASAGASTGPAPAETPAVGEGIRPLPAEEPQKADGEQPSPAPKPTILKSGVIEGIPYTAYSDGSFEAEFAEGTQRFTSFRDLRMHFASRGIG
jgi:hypothetical protein